MKTWHYGLFWILCWSVLVAITLATRPFIPINETRYIGVVWEMWLNHHFLVPLLNGLPYPDKPPLLFWLTQLGWLMFEVNSYWPRIIIPLFSIATVFITYAVARQLWPNNKSIAWMAPTILIGTLYWAFYSPNFRFDMLTAFFTWLSLYGVLLTDKNQRRGWLIVGMSLGLGILSKGPVILVFVLPVIFLAPWWNKNKENIYVWKTWYLWALVAIGLGILIALAWAIPAAISGGKQYAQAIFFSQTAHRLINSKTHVWDYLPQLPSLLTPWLVWPTFWLAVLSLKKQPLDMGARFSLTALLVPLLILSLVSQKGERYLIPLFPAFALFAAGSLSRLSFDRSSRFAQWPLAAAIWLIGLTLIAIPLFSGYLPDRWLILANLNPLWGILLMGIGIGWFFWRPQSIELRVSMLTITTVAVTGIFFLSLQRAYLPNYDLRPLAQQLKKIEDQQQPIAHIDHYDDEYHFLGRLKKPFAEVKLKQIATWAHTHTNGWIIGEFDANQTLPAKEDRAYYRQPFRNNGIVVLWPASAFISKP